MSRVAGRSGRAAAAALATAGQAGLTAVVGYLCLLTAAAFRSVRAAPQSRPDSPHRLGTRFVVLVPAHDEETLIGETVTSLLAVDYPRDLLHVVVVADHCNDLTAERAASAGAEVLHHDDPEPRGKGPALQWAFEQLEQRGGLGDVVIVIDADSVVNEGFLRALHDRFSAGAHVVQARYGVRDAETSDHTRLRSAALVLRHVVRPLGRVALGGSCGLFGNGMAFSSEVLRGRSWSDHLTEDLEFQLELLLQGITVEFARDAVVLAEMPASLGAATSQNERWERGRIDLARRLVPTLVIRAGSPPGTLRRRALVDAAADLVVPPLSVVAAAVGASAVASGAVAAVHRSPASRRRLAWSAGVAVAFVAHVIAGLRLAEVPVSVYRSLLRAPRLIAWKLVLWAKMLVPAREVRWSRTTRNAESSRD